LSARDGLPPNEKTFHDQSVIDVAS
jgi:hypothetical protein